MAPAIVQAKTETEPAASAVQAPVVNPGMIGTSGDPVGPETTPRRRSYVDVTAHPSYRHADDYSSLCGQVQISRLSKGIRLRYASVDETDAYGGSVTFVEDGRLADFKDGQFVRVTGHLLNPGDKAIAPLYRIDSIQPLEKQE
jgi:hypothetical protein